MLLNAPAHQLAAYERARESQQAMRQERDSWMMGVEQVQCCEEEVKTRQAPRGNLLMTRRQQH